MGARGKPEGGLRKPWRPVATRLRELGDCSLVFHGPEPLNNVTTSHYGTCSTHDPQIFNWEHLLLGDGGKIFSEVTSFFLLSRAEKTSRLNHAVNTEEAT